MPAKEKTKVAGAACLGTATAVVALFGAGAIGSAHAEDTTGRASTLPVGASAPASAVYSPGQAQVIANGQGHTISPSAVKVADPAYPNSTTLSRQGVGDLITWPVGTWTVEVTPHGVPVPPFTSTLAYAPGGVAIEATSRPHITPQGALFDFTGGLGVWDLTGPSDLTIDFHKYDFNANGTYAGLTTIHEDDTPSSGGNSYSGTAQVTVTNPSGAVITQFTATSQATRMTS